MEHKYLAGKSGGGGDGRSSKDGDFVEEQMWDYYPKYSNSMHETSADQYHKYLSVRGGGAGKDGDFEEEQMWDYPNSNSNSKYSSMHETSAAQYRNSSSTSPNLSFEHGSKQVYNNNNTSSSSSAPMAIPDWHKIYGTPHQPSNEDIFEDGDYEDDKMIPPHEYIAKKLASSQISSSSVCEGAGRTLKGRDLSRVRNAILTKTGFIE